VRAGRAEVRHQDIYQRFFFFCHSSLPPRFSDLVALSFFSGTKAFSGLGCVRFRWETAVEGWERSVKGLCDDVFLAGNLKTF